MTASLHLRSLGSGDVVLLLHGTPQPSETFGPLADRLARTHRVLVADLPGYGASPRIQPNRTPIVRALIEEALSEIGVAEVSIVGASGGGYRALEIAREGRVRVRRLVLLGSPVHFPDDAKEGLRQFARAVRGGVDLHAAVGEQLLSAAYRAAHPQEARAAERWLDACPPEVLADELDAWAEAEDLRPFLPSLAVPILARFGSADVAVSPEHAEIVERLCPLGRREIVPGAAHGILVEDAEGTLASIDAFLRA